MNELIKHDSTALVQTAGYDFKPTNFDQAWHLAQIMSDSDLVPKDYRKKPQNVFIAMQAGHEIGLPHLQAVQSIAIINGRPSIWGDALLALVKGSPLCEYFTEEWDEATQTATARTLRKGDPSETIRTFSFDDAKAAGLLGKQGPWTQYKKRMCQMRARGFCARDAYPDVLRGIQSAEEQQDIPRPVGSGTTRQQPAPEPVQKVEVLPLTEDGEKELIMHHAAILDMASNIGDLKSAFTDAYRAAKSAGSDKAQAELKGFYDSKKAEIEQLVIEAEPEQSDADWLADLKEAE